MAVKQLSATEARNNFFNLLTNSYLKKEKYLVSKGNVPMVYIVPVKEGKTLKTKAVQNKQLKILRSAKRIRNSTDMGTDSVKLLREIREYGSGETAAYGCL